MLMRNSSHEPGLTVGDTVTKLGFLTAMEVIGFRINRDHIVLLNYQKQGSQNYSNGLQSGIEQRNGDISETYEYRYN